MEPTVTVHVSSEEAPLIGAHWTASTFLLPTQGFCPELQLGCAGGAQEFAFYRLGGRSNRGMNRVDGVILRKVRLSGYHRVHRRTCPRSRLFLLLAKAISASRRKRSIMKAVKITFMHVEACAVVFL